MHHALVHALQAVLGVLPDVGLQAQEPVQILVCAGVHTRVGRGQTGETVRILEQQHVELGELAVDDRCLLNERVLVAGKTVADGLEGFPLPARLGFVDLETRDDLPGDLANLDRLPLESEEGIPS